MFDFVAPDVSLQPPKVYAEPCDECVFEDTLGGWSCNNEGNHTNV